MSKKIEDSKRGDERTSREADTATYEQQQGAPDREVVPNRQRPRMPHERDESAASTGNRLDQEVPPSGHKISQAAEDVDRGLVDTDRRGIPSDIPKGEHNRKR